jgi:hypothetical protein
MNAATGEGYAEASEAQPVARSDDVAALPICSGRAAIPANVAVADLTK